jgi:hypothetical protein
VQTTFTLAWALQIALSQKPQQAGFAERRLGCLLSAQRRRIMSRLKSSLREGKAGWIILWLLGIPIPVLLALFLIRGCT